MTQAQADAAAREPHRARDRRGQRRGGRTGHGHRGPGGLDADDLTAAAGALGMTEADLTTALQGGQTVAAVATSKGVDLQKVIDAIVASDKAEIAAAVTAGTMTQAQADAAAREPHRARDRRGQRRGGRTGQPPRPRRSGPERDAAHQRHRRHHRHHRRLTTGNGPGSTCVDPGPFMSG